MIKMVVNLAITAAIGGLLLSNPTTAQNPPPAPKAPHVEITKGPELESAGSWLAIIRWTTNNPGGDDDHFAVVHYGTEPTGLTDSLSGQVGGALGERRRQPGYWHDADFRPY